MYKYSYHVIVLGNRLDIAVGALENCNSETEINQEEFECLRRYLGFVNEEELKSYLKHNFVS